MNLPSAPPSAAPLRPLHGVLLAGLFLAQAAFLLLWLKADTRPPAWDESHHLQIALEYRDALAAGDWARPLRPSYSNYPPFYHLLLAAALPPRAPEGGVQAAADRAVAVNLFFLSVLALSLFQLGRRLDSPETGLAAAALGSFYPGLLFLLRRPMIDFPLAAWVALAYVCLWEAEDFRRPAWSAVLGGVLGLGFLLKWTFGVYVALPLAWALWNGVRARRWKPLGLALAVFLAAAGPWYLLNGVSSFVRVRKLSSLKEAGDPGVWSLAGWTWYARGVFRLHFLWLLGVPYVCGLALAFRRRWRDLLLWALVPLALFSLIQNKDLRYYVPCLPAAALLSVLFVKALARPPQRAAWRAGWTGAALGLALLQGFGFAAPLMERLKLPADFATKADWKTDEILGRVRESARGAHPRLALVANHPYFHSVLFSLASRLRDFPVTVLSPKNNLGDFSDFILYKRGDLGPAFTLGYLTEARELLERPPLWLEKTFSPVEEWPLPDGSSAVLLQKDPKPVPWPSGLGEVDISLRRFPLPRFEAEGLRVRLVPGPAASAARGAFARILLECRSLNYRGLVLREAALDCREVEVNLPRLLQEGELHLLRVGEVRPSVRITAETLRDYLAKKARWLKETEVSLENGRARVRGKAAGVSVEAEASARLSPDRRSLRLAVERARLAGVPLPLFLARKYTRKVFSLEPSKGLPFRVAVEDFGLENGVLSVNGEDVSRRSD